MAGFQGRMLEVNLSKGSSRETFVEKDSLRKYIGGSGLGAKLLFDRVSPDVDPLSPENTLFVLGGPISGTSLPGGARFSICAKSPQTDMWGEACCGGNFAAEMRGAGWDGIIVEGASDRPAYVLVEDGKVEIKDASDLWGKDTHQVADLLKEQHGKKAKILSIGDAGERLVKFAAVANDNRGFAARCGMGAVMGSKKLKAIVVKGNGKIEMADPERFAECRKVLIQKAKDHIATQVLGMMGTNAALGVSAVTGDLPAKNWMIGDNSTIAAGIDGSVLSSPQYLTGNDSCHGCMVGCKRMVQITEGPYKGMSGPGPEYEGVASLGSLLMIGDMAAVIRMNEICNQHGIDCISAGATLAMVMDCWERGIISAKDTDGIEMTWGNAEAAIQMLHKIARREGFGDILAEGSKRASEKIGNGASQCTVEIKGMEVPMHDPRANYAAGLAYATGIRGACHTSDPSYSLSSGVMDWPELGLVPTINLKESSGLAQVVKNCQDLGGIYNSAVLCYMLIMPVNAEDITNVISAASGFDYDFKELIECGERIWHLKRGLSNLMGIAAKDDRLPKQILTPTTEGGSAGCAPDIELMLKEFYPVRGLADDGRPTKDTLERLGLSELATKLYT